MKNNKIILALIIGVVFLAPTLVVKAIETVKPVVSLEAQKTADLELQKKKEALLKEAIDKQFEIQKTLDIKKAEIEKKSGNNSEKRVSLETKKQESVKASFNKIFDKIYSKLVKLGEIDAKILALIKAKEAQGKDVSAIKNQYDMAKIIFDKTKGQIFEARIITTNQIKVATSKSVLREVVKKSEDNVKDIANEYRKILPMLAELEGNNSINN